jgi:hypothetical protein
MLTDRFSLKFHKEIKEGAGPALPKLYSGGRRRDGIGGSILLAEAVGAHPLALRKFTLLKFSCYVDRYVWDLYVCQT